jgi:hypothetical protein
VNPSQVFSLSHALAEWSLTSGCGIRKQFQHLDEEVEHIAPEKLKVFEVKSLLELNEELEKYAKGNGNPFLVIPFIVRCAPTRTCKTDFYIDADG